MLRRVLSFILSDAELGPMLRGSPSTQDTVPHIDLDYEERRPLPHAAYLNRHEFQFSIWVHLAAAAAGHEVADRLDQLLSGLSANACPGLIYWETKSRQSAADAGLWRIKTQYVALRDIQPHTAALDPVQT